jgi:hypothetical protein
MEKRQWAFFELRLRPMAFATGGRRPMAAVRNNVAQEFGCFAGVLNKTAEIGANVVVETDEPVFRRGIEEFSQGGEHRLVTRVAGGWRV